jgi:hypothetical protein
MATKTKRPTQDAMTRELTKMLNSNGGVMAILESWRKKSQPKKKRVRQPAKKKPVPIDPLQRSLFDE